jgi:excisionase family DNA binding protein
LASFSQNFAASLLLGQAASETVSVPIADPERLLTVGQVAKLLQVCNATVYKLCKKGELEHTRILNSIRIAPAGLSHLIGRRRKVLR